MPDVETNTPANTPEPIGAYNHVAKVIDNGQRSLRNLLAAVLGMPR